MDCHVTFVTHLFSRITALNKPWNIHVHDVYISVFKDVYLTFEIKFCLRSFKIVSMQFMRKYIHVAKALKPSLTREAAEYIAEEYAKLRSQDNMQNDNIARVINLYFITIPCQSGSICMCMMNLNIGKLS